MGRGAAEDTTVAQEPGEGAEPGDAGDAAGGPDGTAARPAVPLPRRAPGANGAPPPPAELRREYLPPSVLGRRLDSEAYTEPFPRIAGTGPGSGGQSVFSPVRPAAGSPAAADPARSPGAPAPAAHQPSRDRRNQGRPPPNRRERRPNLRRLEPRRQKRCHLERCRLVRSRHGPCHLRPPSRPRRHPLCRWAAPHWRPRRHLPCLLGVRSWQQPRPRSHRPNPLRPRRARSARLHRPCPPRRVHRRYPLPRATAGPPIRVRRARALAGAAAPLYRCAGRCRPPSSHGGRVGLTASQA